MDFSKISSALLNKLVDSASLDDDTDKKMSFPALQVNNYSPSMTEKIEWCLSKDSYSVLSDENKALLKLEKGEGFFGTSSDVCYLIKAPVRFVVLAFPDTRSYLYDKDSEQIQLRENVSFTESSRTICKLFICAIVNNVLLTHEVESEDGTKILPTVFTLKVKSLNIKNWIKGESKDSKDLIEGSLAWLNEQVKKHIKSKKSVLHCVNMDITPFPNRFTSQKTNKASVGVAFRFVNADVNTEGNLDLITTLLKDEDFLTSLKDPFGLKGLKKQKEISQSTAYVPPVEDDEDIPY